MLTSRILGTNENVVLESVQTNYFEVRIEPSAELNEASADKVVKSEHFDANLIEDVVIDLS